jgi:polar amino acid transport system substrate-binding protein
MKIILIFLFLLQLNALNLTKKEKEFIKTHTIKCISTTNWPPFDVLKDNKLEGIGIDYWNLIKQKLNIKSKCYYVDEWDKVLQEIKTKKSDLTISTTITKERKKYAIFSKPYAVFPFVIATKNDVGFIADIELIKNKKIAVGKNFTAAVYVKKTIPRKNIIETTNIYEALKLVSEGKAYAVIDVLPVIVYNINKFNFSNLKISGYTPWKFKVRFMIRKDYPLLKSAINKAINSITQEEKNKIYKKWLTINKEKIYTFKEIFKYIVITSILFLVLIGWIIFLFIEITKRKKLESRLEKIAKEDKLTHIYNRYKIDESLAEQINYAKRNNSPLSVIFFDIDHFKKVNDTYGHKSGDYVLKEIAKIVKNNIRSYDIFGRWGGEEFIILLPNTNIKEAIAVAQKLRKIIESHKFRNIKQITCSFGVTEFNDKDNIEKLIKRVDKYMYEAKKRGRNMVFSDIDKMS